MNYSNKYKSRHGFADFEKLSFQITNKTNSDNIICELIKVPTYSFVNTYNEKICEGNGWYSKGDKVTETITHDFYYLVVLDNECLGVIQDNLKKTISNKYAIQDLNNKKHVREYLKNI